MTSNFPVPEIGGQGSIGLGPQISADVQFMLDALDERVGPSGCRTATPGHDPG